MTSTVLTQPALAPTHAGRSRIHPDAAKKMQDPRYLCTAIGKAVVEVLAGARPMPQLMRWLSVDIYDAVDRRRQYARVELQNSGRLGARVLGTRIQQVAAHAFEASLTVDDRSRVRAVALRLERKNTGWRVVNLEIN